MLQLAKVKTSDGLKLDRAAWLMTEELMDTPLKYIEYRVYGDLIMNMPKPMFYLLKEGLYKKDLA